VKNTQKNGKELKEEMLNQLNQQSRRFLKNLNPKRKSRSEVPRRGLVLDHKQKN
jgi:hypothetical protein